MDRLRQEGLGAGLDISKPEKLLNTQVTPTLHNVDRCMFGTTYQEFFESIQTISEISRGLSASAGLEAIEVSVNVGLEFHGKKLLKTSMTAVGKQIRNETVFFKDSIPESDVILGKFLSEESEARGFRNRCGDEIPQKERDRICRHVIRHRNHGATHYIASVDLGGKIYQVKSECKEERKESVDGSISGSGGTMTLKAGTSVEFSEETKNMAKQSKGQMYFIVDKAVELKGYETSIKAEQEKTIAFQIKPVWDLIKDRAWREAVKKACKQYVEEMTPIPVYSEQKFVIKNYGSGAYQYLKVADDVLHGATVKRVVGTTNRSEASLFFLVYSKEENLLKPGAPFYLCYTDGDDALRLYLTIDHESRTVILQDCVYGDHGRFSLATPCGEKPEAICAWQEHKPLLLTGSYHKHALFGLISNKVKGHLVLQQSSKGNPYTLTINNIVNPKRTILRCQFALERP